MKSNTLPPKAVKMAYWRNRISRLNASFIVRISCWEQQTLYQWPGSRCPPLVTVSIKFWSRSVPVTNWRLLMGLDWRRTELHRSVYALTVFTPLHHTVIMMLALVLFRSNDVVTWYRIQTWSFAKFSWKLFVTVESSGEPRMLAWWLYIHWSRRRWGG